MIFYFSATGNSKHVAERLLDATGGELVSIPECLAAGRFSFSVPEGEAVGVVVPTFFWGLPSIAEEFLHQLELTAPTGTYLYCVATCGATPGACGVYVDKLLRAKGFSLSALFSVKMPDTWTPIFNLSDKDKVAKKNNAAETQIGKTVSRVQQRDVGNFMHGKAPHFISNAFAHPAYEGARRTAHFTVSAECIGCGLCAKKCPAQAIEMRDGRPNWVKEQCALCLGCLHRCPKFAIQYGNRTKVHGQYQNPHTKV
ncbi:MAG: EFR1 family ferrodoxin [Oscillospiraceae bacterium]|nr:EFR1 family ferrodoxin [Oscillospiraceae bacterium]